MNSASRRLLIRPGAIGDCIVSLPALEFARTRYTEVWVAAQNVPLIRFGDRVRAISSTGLDLLELRQPVPELRAFDSVYSWYGESRLEFRQAVEGLPFTFFPALPRGGDVHAIDFYMRQVGGPDGAVPEIDVGPVARRDFIAIHPFSGSPKKNWPYFQELASRLPLPVEWCAGPRDEWDGALRFERLDEVARWLASARAYVGNDSGITHLAAAVGTPILALFRNSDPRVWVPRGRAAVRMLLDPGADEAAGSVAELLDYR